MRATYWARTSVLVAATMFAVTACSRGDDAADTDTVTRSAGGEVRGAQPRNRDGLPDYGQQG